MRKLVVLLGITAAAAAIMTSAATGTTRPHIALPTGFVNPLSTGTGTCGPYYSDPTEPGSQYRFMGYDQSAAPPDTAIAANLTMKSFHQDGATSNDFMANWIMFADGSSNDAYHIEAGINIGNGSPGNNWTTPELYVETKDPTNGYVIHPMGTANLLTSYTVTIFRNTGTRNYYVTFNGGGYNNLRYPASGYITEPSGVTFPADEWENEELDYGESSLSTEDCPWSDNTQDHIKVNGALNLASPITSSPTSQTFWQLDNSGNYNFEIWANNCFYQGKCNGPIQ